ncbi:recombinase family protein (plasmid) [Ligilactobacillus salivarius]|uniref:recombinase n=1 Tax=Ligilactobacillus salivarius TaxID=1624 RepID=UPI00178509BB|nr:recombinase [Ligilactobacillus salivarius]QXL50548.1 recombinase family protein [Ligilactobacillus salivarius]
MAYIPYGYKIQDGVVTVDEKAAGQVKVFFEKYISGLSLTVADEQAGIEKTHSVMGRILKNVNYLGNDTYPAIIDKEIFDKAEEVRDKRAKDLGRVVELAAFTSPSPSPKERFKMKKADNKMPVDPFERAEYLYSLIESEE